MNKIDWKETVISLFFPRRCPVCGDVVHPFGQFICPECVKKLSPVKQPVCHRCGKEIVSAAAEYCPDCMRRKRTFERNFALLNYDDTARRSMAAVKYKGRREYLAFYSQAVCLRYGRIIRRAAPRRHCPCSRSSFQKETEGI